MRVEHDFEHKNNIWTLFVGQTDIFEKVDFYLLMILLDRDSVSQLHRNIRSRWLGCERVQHHRYVEGGDETFELSCHPGELWAKNRNFFEFY